MRKLALRYKNYWRLFGAAFLVLCDLLARTIMAPLELPVGIITAFQAALLLSGAAILAHHRQGHHHDRRSAGADRPVRREAVQVGCLISRPFSL